MLFDDFKKFSENVADRSLYYSSLTNKKTEYSKMFRNCRVHKLIKQAKIFMIKSDSVDQFMGKKTDDEIRQIKWTFPFGRLPFEDGTCLIINNDQVLFFLYDLDLLYHEKDLLGFRSDFLKRLNKKKDTSYGNDDVIDEISQGCIIFKPFKDGRTFGWSNASILHTLLSDNKSYRATAITSFGTYEPLKRQYSESEISNCPVDIPSEDPVNKLHKRLFKADEEWFDQVLYYINQPKTVIVGERSIDSVKVYNDYCNALKENRPAKIEFKDMPNYTVKTLSEARIMYHDKLKTGKIVCSHVRCSHPRTLRDDYFVNMKGQTITVKSATIHPKPKWDIVLQETIGNKIYDVVSTNNNPVEFVLNDNKETPETT